MFDLNHLATHIVSTTDYLTCEILNHHTVDSRISEQSDSTVNIAYGRTQSTSEANIILSSYSEIVNPIIQFVKIISNNNYLQHLRYWSQLFKSLSNYHPVYPQQSIELNTFTFVDCDYNYDNGRIISEFTFAYMFDRTWIGDVVHTCSCVTNNNPDSLFNQYNVVP